MLMHNIVAISNCYDYVLKTALRLIWTAFHVVQIQNQNPGRNPGRGIPVYLWVREWNVIARGSSIGRWIADDQSIKDCWGLIVIQVFWGGTKCWREFSKRMNCRMNCRGVNWPVPQDTISEKLLIFGRLIPCTMIIKNDHNLSQIIKFFSFLTFNSHHPFNNYYQWQFLKWQSKMKKFFTWQFLPNLTVCCCSRSRHLFWSSIPTH